MCNLPCTLCAKSSNVLMFELTKRSFIFVYACMFIEILLHIIVLFFQEAERILEKIDTLHLDFAKRAAVSLIALSACSILKRQYL